MIDCDVDAPECLDCGDHLVSGRCDYCDAIIECTWCQASMRKRDAERTPNLEGQDCCAKCRKTWLASDEERDA